MRTRRLPIWTLPVCVLLLCGCLDDGPSAAKATQSIATPAHIRARIAATPTPDTSLTENLLAAEEARLSNQNEEKPEPIARPSHRFPIEAETDPDVLAAGGRQEMRRRHIVELARNPDPTAFRELEAIVLNRSDLLSALAAIALSRIGGIQVERVLEEALSDPRRHVRQVALSGLIDMRAPSAAEHCRVMLKADRIASVRAAAAVGLGLLSERESVGLLATVLREEAPLVRFGSAWSLAKMSDPRGYLYLESLAKSGDPQAAPQAIHILGSLQDRQAVPALYRCLLSSRERVWKSALESLKQVPQEEVEAGLKLLPVAARDAARIRRELLTCLASGGAAPVESFVLATRGMPDERVLALRCLGVGGSIDAIPVTIDAMDDPEARVQITASDSFQKLILRHGLPIPEKGRTDYKRWWFRRYAVLAATRNEALLMTPIGKKQRVQVGSRLEWDATVVRVTPGQGQKQREGAAVKLQLGSRTIDILAVNQ